MNINKQNIDDLNAVITVKVEKADYADRVEKALNDYRKKANMPGFRPGKVPASLVKKMYGKSVLFDEVNKIMSENLSEYLREAEFSILGDPLPGKGQKLIDFDTQEDFEFMFDIALSPVFDLKIDKKDKIKYYNIKTEAEVIDRQIDAHASHFGEYEQVDVVENDDMVRGDFVELAADGSVKENGIVADKMIISTERFADDEAKALVLGKKVGDVVVFNPMAAFKNATEVSSLLKISKEEAEALDSNFSFAIIEITRFRKQAVNADLFAKVYGEGAVTTEEEFRERIGNEIKGAFAENSDYRFAVDARTYLLSKVEDVAMPEEFLKRWIKLNNKDNKEITEEQIDEEFPQFVTNLKWSMVLSKLSKDNDIKITEEDVMDQARRFTRAQFAQYGLNNVPDEHLDNYAREMMGREEQGRQFSERAIEKKVMDFVKSVAKLDEKEVTLADFNKLFE